MILTLILILTHTRTRTGTIYYILYTIYYILCTIYYILYTIYIQLYYRFLNGEAWCATRWILDSGSINQSINQWIAVIDQLLQFQISQCRMSSKTTKRWVFSDNITDSDLTRFKYWNLLVSIFCLALLLLKWSYFCFYCSLIYHNNIYRY